jgi:predicted phage replisome organizer
MKLHWIKLDIDILKHEKIEIIRDYPDGDSLFVLWVGLLTMAMKSDMDGHIMVTKGTPFTPEQIANRLRIPLKTVQMGLTLFNELGMIEVGDYNEILIRNFCKHQSIEEIRNKQALIEHKKAKSRETSRKYREKNKSVKTLHGDTSGDSHVTVSDTHRLDKIRLDKNNTKQDDRFDEFWNKYDKKIAKGSCEKKWKKLSETDKESILSTVSAFVRSTPDVTFRPHPLTYLNQKRWEDELPNQVETKKPSDASSVKARYEMMYGIDRADSEMRSTYDRTQGCAADLRNNKIVGQDKLSYKDWLEACEKIWKDGL